jgi:hypothetical protein
MASLQRPLLLRAGLVISLLTAGVKQPQTQSTDKVNIPTTGRKMSLLLTLE